jgi:hypothetical protein
MVYFSFEKVLRLGERIVDDESAGCFPENEAIFGVCLEIGLGEGNQKTPMAANSIGYVGEDGLKIIRLAHLSGRLRRKLGSVSASRDFYLRKLSAITLFMATEEVNI